MTPKQRKDFFDIFGDLAWRFTRTRRYTECDGYEAFSKYEILAADDNSVVVRFLGEQRPRLDGEIIETLGFGELLSGDYLQQIFFDGRDHIYIQSNWNVEFFKRVT